MTPDGDSDRAMHSLRDLAEQLKSAGLPFGERQLRAACRTGEMPCRRRKRGRKWFASRTDAQRFAEQATESNTRPEPKPSSQYRLSDDWLQKLAAQRKALGSSWHEDRLSHRAP
jgi:hypothetical protein